jgi:hypothetical protein
MSDELRQRNNDFLNVFNGPQGGRVLNYLTMFCLKKGSTFIPGQPDQSAFNEGARSVILEIDHWLELDLASLEKSGETDNIEPERQENE